MQQMRGGWETSMHPLRNEGVWGSPGYILKSSITNKNKNKMYMKQLHDTLSTLVKGGLDIA